MPPAAPEPTIMTSKDSSPATALAPHPDEWWVERRLIARKLLDIGDPSTAYRVVREAVPPNKENYRVEDEFTAGGIALRLIFLAKQVD